MACLCQSIEINNNKHVYRQSQVRKSTDSGAKWAECSLIIGTGCRVQVFSLILDSSVGLSASIQSAGELVSGARASKLTTTNFNDATVEVWEWISYFTLHIVKGIKNGCPCIVEIRGTQGCALVGDPARAVGWCRDVAKAQP